MSLCGTHANLPNFSPCALETHEPSNLFPSNIIIFKHLSPAAIVRDHNSHQWWWCRLESCSPAGFLAAPEQAHFPETLSLSGHQISPRLPHFVTPSCSYHLIASWQIFVLGFSANRSRTTKWVWTLLSWIVGLGKNEFQGFLPLFVLSLGYIFFCLFVVHIVLHATLQRNTPCPVLFSWSAFLPWTILLDKHRLCRALSTAAHCWRSCSPERKDSLWYFKYNFSCVFDFSNSLRRLKLLEGMKTEGLLCLRAPLPSNYLFTSWSIEGSLNSPLFFMECRGNVGLWMF